MTSAMMWGRRCLVVVAAGAMVACVGPEPDTPSVSQGAALSAQATAVQSAPIEAPELAAHALETVRTRTDHLAGLGLPLVRPYKDGDLCTVTSRAWAAECEGQGSPACLLAESFATLYGDEFAVGWRENRVVFSRQEWLLKAMPGLGEPAMLGKPMKDPEAESLNRLAGEIIAMRLSVDFNAHGLMGREPLAQAVLVQGPLAGLTVAEALELSEQALGGFPEKMERRGLNVDTLTLALAWVNGLAPTCEVHTAFMRQGR